MIKLGYTREGAIKMTKSSPSIYNYSIENMKQKIEDIVGLGYTKEEVLKMTKMSSPIYCISLENMKQKIEDMISLGYTKEEVISITKSLPSIYGYSIENIKHKVDFFASVGLLELTILDTRCLMQSVALSYARYKFYLLNGIKINSDNIKKMFISNNQFKIKYGLTKEELLEKYDYNKYLEEMDKKEKK